MAAQVNEIVELTVNICEICRRGPNILTNGIRFNCSHVFCLGCLMNYCYDKYTIDYYLHDNKRVRIIPDHIICPTCQSGCCDIDFTGGAIFNTILNGPDFSVSNFAPRTLISLYHAMGESYNCYTFYMNISELNEYNPFPFRANVDDICDLIVNLNEEERIGILVIHRDKVKQTTSRKLYLGRCHSRCGFYSFGKFDRCCKMYTVSENDNITDNYYVTIILEACVWVDYPIDYMITDNLKCGYDDPPTTLQVCSPSAFTMTITHQMIASGDFAVFIFRDMDTME